MRRIPVGLGPFGRRQLNLVEFTAAMLAIYALLEAGSLFAASALLGRPVGSLVVPYLLFLAPCALLTPFIFAYHAGAERPAEVRAGIFAGGCAVCVGAFSAALPISLSVLRAPAAPLGDCLFAGALATAVGTVVGYRQALAILRRENPPGTADS